MSDAAGPDEPSTDAAVPDNDVKDKFRQALERKRGHQADRDAAADHLAVQDRQRARVGQDKADVPPQERLTALRPSAWFSLRTFSLR